MWPVMTSDLTQPISHPQRSTWWQPLAAMAILIGTLGLLTKLYHHTMPVTVPTTSPTTGEQLFTGAVGATKRGAASPEETVAE